MRGDELMIFSGNGNRPLAERIAERLGVPLGSATVGRFPDGEISVKLEQNIRGGDVFVVQSTCPPVNENLMELLIMIDCFRRASARRITAVVPYFGYARQDRKDESRVPISAKLAANLIRTAGADRVLTTDLHSAQIQGFFDIPVDHLYAQPVLLRYFQGLGFSGVVVGPDVGSIKMARSFSKHLESRLAVVDKRRVSDRETVVGFLIGEVEGMDALIVDDMISTGGSIVEAARVVKKKGARDVYLCATHPVFCGEAMRTLSEAPVRQVVVTDTIPLTQPLDRIEVISVAGLLGDAIHRIHMNESVSSLFN
ncbi:MAG: ribose-phosphate pyrophosphokinase [Planctomycetes bacterium]|nr:ribose-phosphate pyrophosphokinase [Planctomycetota bacterium]